MSQKNKLRFLVCFLFSILAHSSVLVASLFMTSGQISEDQQGATLKAAAQAAGAAPQTVHTVELVDLSQSKMAIPDSVQVAEMARTLPQKTISQNEILMAKDDDPTAVEIKKPTPSKKKVEVAPVAPQPEQKVVKAKPAPKKETPKKIAKISKPKAPKKVVAKAELTKEKAEPKEREDDTLVAQNEEFKPVKEHVDAQASEEPQPKPATEPEVVATEAPAETVVEEAAPTQEEIAPAKSTSKAVQDLKPSRVVQQQEGSGEGDGPAASSASAKGSMGSPVGETPGGTLSGIRDGDSLAELNGNLRPLYPVEDRRARREGVSVFIARVTPDGRVQDIRLESSGTPSMNSAAMKAFANYHYKAGQEGWVRKKFVFKLTGESEEPARLRRSNSAVR